MAHWARTVVRIVLVKGRKLGRRSKEKKNRKCTSKCRRNWTIKGRLFRMTSSWNNESVVFMHGRDRTNNSKREVQLYFPTLEYLSLFHFLLEVKSWIFDLNFERSVPISIPLKCVPLAVRKLLTFIQPQRLYFKPLPVLVIKTYSVRQQEMHEMLCGAHFPNWNSTFTARKNEGEFPLARSTFFRGLVHLIN